MKEFFKGGNSRSSLSTMRRLMAFVLALMMLAPSNIVMTLVDGFGIAQSEESVGIDIISAEQEAAMQAQAEEEEAARKQAEEEEAARKQAEEEEAARKQAEEEAARKQAEEEEAARKQAEEEEAAR